MSTGTCLADYWQVLASCGGSRHVPTAAATSACPPTHSPAHPAFSASRPSGTNCAYLERVSAISKLPPGFTPRTGRMIVNSEWADFRSPLLPSCDEDVWLDCSSPHPGSGVLEKQMSGLYLGEGARRCLLRWALAPPLRAAGCVQLRGKAGLLGKPLVAQRGCC